MPKREDRFEKSIPETEDPTKRDARIREELFTEQQAAQVEASERDHYFHHEDWLRNSLISARGRIEALEEQLENALEASGVPAVDGELALGSLVSWSSQAQGWTRTKVGTIYEVVSAGKKPTTMNPALTGSSRKETSYVVSVRVGNRAPKLYWPNARSLQPGRREPA